MKKDLCNYIMLKKIKKISSILFFLFLFISAKGQTGYFKIKTISKGESFQFPIFSNAKDSNTSRRINQFLQLKELEQVCDTKLQNIFEVVAKDDKDIYGGSKYDLTYEIKANNSKIVSMAFNESYCGATCTYWTGYYTFNSGNGDVISLEDLFTKEGFDTFNTIIKNERVEKFNKESLKFDSTQKDFLEENIECIKTDKLEYFYIKDSAIYIDGEHCLNKWQRFDDLDMEVAFYLDEFKMYLNNYGKTVFGLTKENIAKYRSNNLPQLFEGNIGNNKIAMILENSYDAKIYGRYAYLKHRKSIEFSGSLSEKALELIENYGEIDTNGTFNAIFDGNKITGTWTNKDKTKKMIFKVKR